MSSYEDYLKALGHTTFSVVEEKLDPIKKEMESLSNDIENQKQECLGLLADIARQEKENMKEEKDVKLSL